MTAVRAQICFLLNDREERLTEVRSSETLLDHLRLARRLRGTKEGCAEGDCGACTVLVGRRTGDSLTYEPVNACIRLLASVDLCHVVTVEHVGRHALHPVQTAMIDLHGSQCGFCTPGFVMSLYALWMRAPKATETEIEEALQGNLCRCTGYQPIIAAAKAAGEASPANDPLLSERARVRAALDALDDGARVDLSTGDDRVLIPSSAADLAAILAEVPKPTIVAGSTDVGLWITKFMRDISPAVFINNLADLQTITVGPDAVTIGAGVTYDDFQATLDAEFPHLSDYWRRIGGWQVRAMGTVGGN
ncbi:MAG TPA: 2Fe-2S iron-sulfur cluster-binding protein, partial [Amaricoccus sp.]|nr:2Fe-2S iron-sulfur cluster-binding protein [Amaricoccus sp.]